MNPQFAMGHNPTFKTKIKYIIFNFVEPITRVNRGITEILFTF